MRTTVIIFISSLVLQIIMMQILLGNSEPQRYEYEELAVNLLTRYTYVCNRLGTDYYSIVTPLYPFLCAEVYLITNYSHLAMLLVQIVLISLTCAIIYLTGEHIFEKKIGLFSAILCIFHPGLIIYSTTKLHDLSLVVFIFCLLIFTLLRYERDMTYKNSLIIGLLFGLSILTRASIVLFIPLYILWLFSAENNIIRKTIFKKIVFIIFVTGLVILPWTIRNYYVHRKFVFMQTPSVDFWVGNNNNASGGNYLKDGRYVLYTMPAEFVNKIYSSDELTQDRIFKEEVYRFIKEHPYKFLSLFFKKLYYFWWFSPQTGLKYPHIFMAGYKILYSIALSFAIWGIILTFTSGKQEMKRKVQLLLLFFLSISVVQSLFYVEGRHRWAVEPLLLILTAQGLNLAINRIKKLRWIQDENIR